MAINTKKPAMKQTVGAQYMCFANTTEGGEYDGTYEADVEKTEVVKSVKVTENSETSDVYASGKIYDSDSPMSSIDIEVSVIAFPDDTISKMRGETKGTGGLILAGGKSERPFFAYGKVVKLKNKSHGRGAVIRQFIIREGGNVLPRNINFSLCRAVKPAQQV